MPHSFKLSRRIARFRAPVAVAFLLSLAACNDDSFNPDRSTTPDPVDQVPLGADDGESPVETGRALVLTFSQQRRRELAG